MAPVAKRMSAWASLDTTQLYWLKKTPQIGFASWLPRFLFIEQSIKHRKAQEGTTPKESLTQLTVVIHQDDFVQEVAGGAVQDAVHRAEQGGQRLVVETNHNAGRGQISRVGLLSASANRNRVFGTIYRGVSTGLAHCRNFLRTSKH